MRAYLVKATVPADGDTPAKELRRYAGSQSDAAAAKREIVDKNATVKRNAVTVDPVEIPTDKTGLISWLNKNAV